MGKADESEPQYAVERVAVEIVRPLRHRHLRPDQPDDSVIYKSDADETALHVCVRDEAGEVIGVGSICAENRVAGHGPHLAPGQRVRGMAVETEWRGKGVGRAILEALTDIAQAAEALEVWANARVDAINLYERAGFERLSTEFEIPRIGAHVVVARAFKAKRRGAE